METKRQKPVTYAKDKDSFYLTSLGKLLKNGTISEKEFKEAKRKFKEGKALGFNSIHTHLFMKSRKT